MNMKKEKTDTGVRLRLGGGGWGQGEEQKGVKYSGGEIICTTNPQHESAYVTNLHMYP